MVAGVIWLQVMGPVCVLALSFWWWLRKSAEATRLAWGEAASSLGLLMHGDTWISGTHRGLRIVVRVVVEHGEESSTTDTHFGISGESICRRIEVRRRSLSDAFKSGRVVTGDDAFDARVEVRGDPSTAIALLDRRVRGVLLEHLGDLKLEGGQVVLKRSGVIKDPQQLIAQGVRVAQALALPEADVPGVLAANFRGARTHYERLRSLELLADGFPESPEARGVASEARRSGNPGVRLAGARLTVTPEAAACLVELLDPAKPIEPGVRVAALKHLLTFHAEAQLGETLEAAFAAGPGELRCVVARAISAGQHLRLLGARLAEPLAAPVQKVLIELLASDVRDWRAAAASALGAAGTLEAVEFLVPLTKGLNKWGEVQLAARDAVRAIQERAGAEGVGRLSVMGAGERAGGLSVPALDGAVSVVER